MLAATTLNLGRGGCEEVDGAVIFSGDFHVFFVSDLRLSKVAHRRGHRRGLAFYYSALPSPCQIVPSVREGVGARDSVSGCVETL